MAAPVSVSVVIPVYNEERRLAPSLDEVLSYLRAAGRPWELLVVDDGSSDGTAALVEARAAGEPGLRLLRLGRNRGKGAAVRAGMLAATGEIRLFRDADSSTSIEHLELFLKEFEKGSDVVIGSRRVPGVKVLRHQPLLRERLGQGFTLLSRALLVWEVRDFTCGFKAFSAKASEEVFSRQLIERWSFDSEILYIASRLGLRISQVPVTWTDDPASKVRLSRDVVGSFVELLRILANSWRGAYRFKQAPARR